LQKKLRLSRRKNPINRDNKLNKWRHRKVIDKWKEYETDEKELKCRVGN